MRDIWRSVSYLVGTTVRTEPWRSAAALLEPLAGLTMPLMAVWLKLITDGVVDGDVVLVAVGIAGIALAQGLFMVIALIGNDARITLSERMGFVFDREVAQATAALPGLDHHERADYLDRLELLRQNRAELSNSLNSVLNITNALLRGLGTIAVLAFLNPILLILVVLALPAVPLARLQQRWHRAAEEESAQPSRLARHLRSLTVDRNAGMELRVFGLANEIRERYRTAATAARAPIMRAERWSTWAGVARQSMLAVGYTAAVGFVLWQALTGSATIGDVVAAAYICQTVAGIVVWELMSVANLGRVLRAANRLLWLRDYAESASARRTGDRPPPERLRHSIEFDHVTFTYPGTDRVVLADVSLRIPAGSVVALVGENGAGKTTLVKLLTRMYEPTTGRILVDGTELGDIDVDQWRARLSAAFQDFARLELRAQHTVGVGDLPKLDDEPSAQGALERAGATDVGRALPNALTTQLGSSWPDGVDLSTGQWQKLALGRSMMRSDPLVVFFDEPTASLDSPTEHALFERYAAAAREGSAAGSITVLVSHRFSTVRSADYIVVLDAGRIVETGTHDELMRAGGMYAELYGLQARSYA